MFSVYNLRNLETDLNKSHIINTDEDPGLWIESCAVINLRGVFHKQKVSYDLIYYISLPKPKTIFSSEVLDIVGPCCGTIFHLWQEMEPRFINIDIALPFTETVYRFEYTVIYDILRVLSVLELFQLPLKVFNL